jgi:hypothetical protein
VTTSSQPAAIDTNLEALISDTTSSGSNNDEGGPIDFVDVVDAETQGQSMTDETPGPRWGNLPKKRMSKKHGRSETWKYFEVFKENKYKAWAYCTICESDVYYTNTTSTGMLVRHLRKYHRDSYDEVMELELQKKQKLGGMEPAQKENQPK